MGRGVITWADGYGIWWASVPRTHNARADSRRARRAIITELREREARLDPRVIRVEMRDVTDDRVIYREVDR